MKDSAIHETIVQADFDNGIATRAALGVVVLQTDESLEPELHQAFPERDVALHHSRIPNADEVTPETLRAMSEELPRALSLLPTARPLDVVAYACTSASTVIGQDKVADLINAAHPGAATTDPISAVIAACRHANARRLAMLTPYAPAVSAAMRELLENAGFEITAIASFNQSSDRMVARLTPRCVRDAALQLGKGDNVDAVFASCTNLRSFTILDEVEASIGKPIISSNAALAWHMRTLAGLDATTEGPGSLLRGK